MADRANAIAYAPLSPLPIRRALGRGITRRHPSHAIAPAADTQIAYNNVNARLIQLVAP
jgi:hypothetical protein